MPLARGQARSLPTSSLRPLFLAFNAVVYAVQAALWVLSGLAHSNGAHPQLLNKQQLRWGVSGVALWLACMPVASGGCHTCCACTHLPVQALARARSLHAGAWRRMLASPWQQVCGLLRACARALCHAHTLNKGLRAATGTQNLLRIVSCAFLAVVSVCAAVGFLVYGGRLFLMLRR